jgi:hypothetical protein
MKLIMWVAYFQANEEARHQIAPPRRFRHTAEYDVSQFVAKMSNPEVGIWWTWIEETTVYIYTDR